MSSRVAFMCLSVLVQGCLAVVPEGAILDAGACEPVGTWELFYARKLGCAPTHEPLVIFAVDGGVDAVLGGGQFRGRPHELTFDAAHCRLQLRVSRSWESGGEPHSDARDLSLSLYGDQLAGMGMSRAWWCGSNLGGDPVALSVIGQRK